MFPPETTSTTRLPMDREWPERRGASGVAPEGSAKILAFLIMTLVAVRMSSSESVKDPSTFREQASYVRSPSAEGINPSAIEAGEWIVITFFSFRALVSFGAARGSTP